MAENLRCTPTRRVVLDELDDRTEGFRGPRRLLERRRTALCPGRHDPKSNMRIRALIVLVLLLLAASLRGMLSTLFKPHASTGASVVAWIAIAAFVAGVIALLVSAVRARRGAGGPR